MMIIAIDLGGSYTKIISFRDTEFTYHEPIRKENTSFDEIVKSMDGIEKIIITGGHALTLPDVIDDIPVVKIHEFEALVAYGRQHSQEQPYLLVNIGSGTPTILINQDQSGYRLGTAIGGATLVGLSRSLLGIDSIPELEQLAINGKQERINLTVGDIVGGPIGILPADAVASVYAKANQVSRKEDLALGLFHIIGESLGAFILSKLESLAVNKVLITGMLAKSNIIQQIVRMRLEPFEISVVFDDKPAYSTLLGAINKYHEDHE
ncbi:MAG: hypothetical protein INQ03_17385 [Candidatus Heimdallarchaeota archaeon]|nr:hypothetical protein [Candidatus Heimdallarchaeota archaeon]